MSAETINVISSDVCEAAGAVLPNEAVNLAPAEVETCAGENRMAEKRLVHAANRKVRHMSTPLPCGG